jgi:SCP-2 sterol transfer family.
MKESEIETEIDKAANKANEYIEKKLSGFNRNIKVRVDEKELYFKIENSKVERTNKEEKTDITISMSAETMKALVSEKLSLLEAYATKKVKVKAKIQDLLYLNRLL